MDIVSSQIIQEIASDCRKNFSGVFPKSTSFEQIAHNFISPIRAREELERLSEMTGSDLKKKRILEIGSGYGINVVIARKEFGAEAFGVEPGQQFQGTFEISQKILAEHQLSPQVIRQGVGEALPFESYAFDLVYSNNVLEHVQNPKKVIEEALRVLKPGGWFFLSCPNYGSWWEGHYGLLMLPHSPKWFLKLMVRFFGRDPGFVDTLQLITRSQLRKWIAPHAVEVKTFGEELFQKRLKSLEFSEWGFLGKLKSWIQILRRLGLLTFISQVSKRLGWETPFVVVLQKKSELQSH